MIAALAGLFGALSVFVGIGALTGQFSYSQRRVAARTVSLQRGGIDEKPRDLVSMGLLKDDAVAGSARVSAVLRKYSWVASRAALLEQADLPLKVSEYVLVLVVTFAGLTALVTLTSGMILIGLLFGVVGVLVVEVWVRSRARRRLELFNKQLPVALQVMATSLRSGFGVMEAVQTVSREMDDPLAGEFGLIIDQSRVGGSFEAGVAAMVARVKSNDLRIVARALEIHRKVGGDLAAILDSVASTMREREELRGHITALTAQQRLGGMIVGLLPAWVVGFFLVVNPEFISPLWQEPLGRVFLAAGASMELVAFVAMRKIMTIEV
ncbi:MAG: secretion system protein [Chloroflexi bacterium]|nr:type II secretion system F family protein [Dehalococcoidia bacterium]MCZ7575719.1 type II secretion system F family protein [Dehalococcoidia bacterium]NJD66582.1 secretion system protein [Chloroflexota bacterium]PWB42608.1 MAG: secretion system protein [Dehalococcoidia bacterium]